MDDPGRSIRWRALDRPGVDVARLVPQGDGHRLAGVATFRENTLAVVLDYYVEIDSQWRTTSCGVKGTYGEQPIEVLLRADANGNWWRGEQPCDEVAGCIDIDLGFSPSTNLLPLRRLALPIGSRAAVAAAWLTVPKLRLMRLEQEYARLDERTYQYRAGDFAAVLRVRADGFVENYPGLWQADGQ